MITSTRRVSPDKSEVRIAFSLDDPSGKHTHTHTHTPSPPQTRVCLGYHLFWVSWRILIVEHPDVARSALLSLHFQYAWNTCAAFLPPKQTRKPPPHTHTHLTPYHFNCVHSSSPSPETGAPSISVGPQHIKKLTTHACVQLCTRMHTHTHTHPHTHTHTQAIAYKASIIIIIIIYICFLNIQSKLLGSTLPTVQGSVRLDVSLQWGRALGQQLQLRNGRVRFPL